MRVRYAASHEAWTGFRRLVKARASQSVGGRICEVGGGANPCLQLKFVQKLGLNYVIADTSEKELDKLPIGYDRLHLDVTRLPRDLDESFDLVITRMVAEHVTDARAFHENIFRMLAPGGTAIHFFPTMYSIPFVLNRILPARISDLLLHRIQPGRESEGSHGKFPAYYRWCHGPTRNQRRRLASVGFEVEEYVGFFGHSGQVTVGPGYWDRSPMLTRLHEWLSEQLLRHPVASMTSYACVVLGKPAETTASLARFTAGEHVRATPRSLSMSCSSS